jgi:SAM-dependent methyltransferase
MARAILDPTYWKGRLERARAAGTLYHAVYVEQQSRWDAIERKHRAILARTIGPCDSVLDAGCGYGRLLTLMPDDWTGFYRGIDLSYDMVTLARAKYPDWMFAVGDLRALPFMTTPGKWFEWAVMVSVRAMVIRECGRETWAEMERELRRVARRLLYLEYDPDDSGSVE